MLTFIRFSETSWNVIKCWLTIIKFHQI